MTFTRLIIDSGETYLLPSLSRIYHNESVAVSGLPLMALTVSTKKSGAPVVVFVELIPIVGGTYIQMCVYPVSHSALWWLCQHCPFAARLYLMDAKKRKSKRLLHASPSVCASVWLCGVSVCACLWVYLSILYIERAFVYRCASTSLAGSLRTFASVSCGLQKSSRRNWVVPPSSSAFCFPYMRA